MNVGTGKAVWNRWWTCWLSCALLGMLWGCQPHTASDSNQIRTNRLLAPDSALTKPDRMIEVQGRSSTVAVAGAGLHFLSRPAVTSYEGRLWVLWGASSLGPGAADQFLQAAWSADGSRWSEPETLVLDPDAKQGALRWLPVGWLHAGHRLFALAIFSDTEAGARTKDSKLVPKVFHFERSSSGWRPAGVLLDDCFTAEVPHQLDTRLACFCQDWKGIVRLATADIQEWRSWTFTPIFEEPPYDDLAGASWYRTDDGMVHAIQSKHGGKEFLLLATSQGGGGWTRPEQTNYPDSGAGVTLGRLQRGWFYLINRPFADKPLTVSFSARGKTFTRSFWLPSTEKPVAGEASQVSAQEWEDALWVVYSTGPRIVALRIPTAEFGLPDLRFTAPEKEE